MAKDDFLRPGNPILFDMTEHMADDELKSMRNRIMKELERDRKLVKTKEHAVDILEQELNARGLITLWR